MMNFKLLAATAATIAACGASTAAADTVIVAGTGQSDAQGVNSTQSAVNSESGGPFVTGDSTPTSIQDSANTLTNGETIGGAAGQTTLVAPDATQCFCQSSQQGVNSGQVGGGTQTSTNIVASDEIIGGFGDTTIIGSTGQSNNQGANSSQSTSGATQTSTNLLASDVILGG
jgi:hypothetical protein